MSIKSKKFRVGVEGATTDGRAIQREWLEQMAANYDKNVYAACVNMEHYKSPFPDSYFGRYGEVLALHTEEIADGALAGKLALYAEIEPTQDLVALNKRGQKLYTSMEINPKFADFGSAYLIGLAVTDDPASLGTERLTFSAKGESSLAGRKVDRENLFSVAEEALLEFVEVTEKPPLLERVKALFAKKDASDNERFNDVHRAVELCAEQTQRMIENLSVVQKSVDSAAFSELQQRFDALQERFDSLAEQLSSQDASGNIRPLATGQTKNDNLTDC